MFQYAIGRRLSMEHNVPLKLDLRFFKGQSLREFDLRRLCVTYDVASDLEIKELSIGPGLFWSFLGIVGIKTIKPKSYIKEVCNPIFDQRISFCDGRAYLDGYWQNELYFKEIRDVLLREFNSKEDVSERFIKYREEICASNSVSVHVRRGDYVSNKKAMSFHGLCPVQYYNDAINLMIDLHDDATFFVFSDDIPWCKENIKYDRGFIYVEGGSNIEDMLLMKHCSHNIVANSTFSWWAAWLNDNKHKVIVAPKAWVVNSPEKAQWVPEEWIVL